MNGEGEKGEEDLAQGEEERITYFSVAPSCNKSSSGRISYEVHQHHAGVQLIAQLLRV